MPRHTSQPRRRYVIASTPQPTRAERHADRSAPPATPALPYRPPCARPGCGHSSDVHIPTETTGQPCGSRQTGRPVRCRCLGYVAPAVVLATPAPLALAA